MFPGSAAGGSRVLQKGLRDAERNKPATHSESGLNVKARPEVAITARTIDEGSLGLAALPSNALRHAHPEVP